MKKYRLAFFLIALTGAVLDLVSKSGAFVILKDQPGRMLDLIPGVFGLRWVTNEGIVWGLFPGNNILFLILSSLAIPIIVLLFRLQKNINWWLTVSFGLVLAGAIGNLFDRIVYGAVRDFFDFYLINWAVFNIADTYITVGVIILLVSLFIPEKKQESEDHSVA